MSGPAPVRLAVTGAAGRMGRMVIEAALETPGIEVATALVREGHPWSGLALNACLGRTSAAPNGNAAEGVASLNTRGPGDVAATSSAGDSNVISGVVDAADPKVTSDAVEAFAAADVVVDFTHPTATRSLLPALRHARIALVCGTTGLSDADRADILEAARDVPIVLAANMSLGVNVLLGLVQKASAMLGSGYDLEVLEIHHRHKKDSPSGTALALAEAGLAARGGELRSALKVRGWGQTGPRRPDELGVGALRGGDVVGEHTVFFLGTGERIELTHRATDRRAFAAGAVRAARWVVGQPPGLYSMQDVLGLEGR